MEMLDRIRADNQIAENWLINYNELRKQYRIDRQDILDSSPVPNTTGGGRTGPGNPTVQKVVRLCDVLEAEKWIQTIEDVHSILGEKKLLLVQLRREAKNIHTGEPGRPAWVPYVQTRYTEQIAAKYHISLEKAFIADRTLHTWWRGIIDLTARIAMMRGAL